MGYDKKQLDLEAGYNSFDLPELELEAGYNFFDLMDADLGRVLSILKQQDPDASNCGFLPYMDIHSRGSVGSLLASSYAERVNSAANLILTKGNTLLAEEDINMCTAAHEPPLHGVLGQVPPRRCQAAVQMTVILEG